MRGRWVPPPAEGEGSGKGQGYVARGQRAPPAADSKTIRRHAKPLSPPPLYNWSEGSIEGHVTALLNV